MNQNYNEFEKNYNYNLKIKNTLQINLQSKLSIRSKYLDYNLPSHPETLYTLQAYTPQQYTALISLRPFVISTLLPNYRNPLLELSFQVKALNRNNTPVFWRDKEPAYNDNRARPVM